MGTGTKQAIGLCEAEKLYLVDMDIFHSSPCKSKLIIIADHNQLFEYA